MKYLEFDMERYVRLSEKREDLLRSFIEVCGADDLNIFSVTCQVSDMLGCLGFTDDALKYREIADQILKAAHSKAKRRRARYDGPTKN